MDPSERIIAAAVRLNGLTLSLPPPARHADLIRLAFHETLIQPDDQGFLTNKARFVGRIEARDIAVQNMGIKPDHRYHLFSEDLW